MLNKQHPEQSSSAPALQVNDTYLLNPLAENALSQIAHNRFEVKHQLVLHMLVAQSLKSYKLNEQDDPALENHLDVSTIGNLYLFLHELEYENDVDGIVTDEAKHGRINFLQKRNDSLQKSLVQTLQEKERLEEELEQLKLPSKS